MGVWVFVCVYVCVCVCVCSVYVRVCALERERKRISERVLISMGWLRLVGSLNYRFLLQKSPIKEPIVCKRNL